LIRRGITVVAILAAIGASAALASARPATRGAQTILVTSSVSKAVTSSGRYLVVVRVRAHKPGESVTVYLPGTSKRRLNLSSSTTTTLRYHLTLKHMPTKLTVRVVSPQPGVALEMSLKPDAAATPSTPAPTPTTAPSGESSPVSTGPAQYPNPYTTLVWDDEFSGAAGSAPDSSNWTVAGGQGQCGNDTLNTNTSDPANVQQNGQGQLAITAQDNGGSYTSAQIASAPVTTFPYGAVEASIKLPPGQGLCSAFWLNGQASSGCSWPCAGEIDILESPAFGTDPDYAIFTLHGPITPDTDDGNYQQFETNTSALGDLSAGYHTYAVIWSPGSIVWTIDGVEYASATPDSLVAGSTWVFDESRAYSIILDLAVGGWPCDSTGNPVAPPSPCPGAAFPAQMLVDWVRVYH
jgi:beta-glucanase (GH16 family)